MKLVQDLPELFEEFGEKQSRDLLDIKEYRDKRSITESMHASKDGMNDWDVTQCYKIVLSGFAKGESVKEILKELWEYTKVSICIYDYQQYVRIGVGILAYEKDYPADVCVECKLEQVESKVLAICEGRERSKIEKLIEIVANSYHVSRKNERKETRNKKPDFLWIMSDRKIIEQKLFERLSEWNNSHGEFSLDDDGGIFVSGLCGMNDRELLIEDCRNYIDDYDGNLLIGNGFCKETAIQENKKILTRLIDYISRNSVKKKIHLVEEYYHELAVSYIGNNVRELAQSEEIMILKQYDNEHNTKLYGALYWYLRTKRNVTKGAAKLKIHRNTMISRIAKINELIHIDEKDGAECEMLLINMEIDSYIKQRSKTSLINL